LVNGEALWIKRARHGDDESFGSLVEAYQKPVFNLCYRMLGNANDAEDAAQESFIRAYRHLRRYNPKRSFATWLLSIASHYCIDCLRKKQLPTMSTAVIPEETVPDTAAPNPERKIFSLEKQTEIQTLLEKINPTDRAAIIFRYWYDYSEVEIAEALSLSVSAVKSRLFRARRELAKLWLSSQPSNGVKERRPDESPAL